VVPTTIHSHTHTHTHTLYMRYNSSLVTFLSCRTHPYRVIVHCARIYTYAIHALHAHKHTRGLSVSILSKTISRVFVYYTCVLCIYTVYLCIINVCKSVWTYMGFRRHYQKHITLSFLTHTHTHTLARIDAERGLTCSSIPSDSRDPFFFSI